MTSVFHCYKDLLGLAGTVRGSVLMERKGWNECRIVGGKSQVGSGESRRRRRRGYNIRYLQAVHRLCSRSSPNHRTCPHIDWERGVR